MIEMYRQIDIRRETHYSPAEPVTDAKQLAGLSPRDLVVLRPWSTHGLVFEFVSPTDQKNTSSPISRFLTGDAFGQPIGEFYLYTNKEEMPQALRAIGSDGSPEPYTVTDRIITGAAGERDDSVYERNPVLTVDQKTGNVGIVTDNSDLRPQVTVRQFPLDTVSIARASVENAPELLDRNRVLELLEREAMEEMRRLKARFQSITPATTTGIFLAGAAIGHWLDGVLGSGIGIGVGGVISAWVEKHFGHLVEQYEAAIEGQLNQMTQNQKDRWGTEDDMRHKQRIAIAAGVPVTTLR